MSRALPAILAIAFLSVSAPFGSAFAFSAETSPTNSDGSSQVADPDDQLDDIANPGSSTGGSGMIEEPTSGFGQGGSVGSDSQDQPSIQITIPSDNGN